MMVRCEENIVNIDVSLKSHIFDFFDILGSSGRPGTSFWAAFWEPGAAFWWSGGVLGIYCNIGALAGLAGEGPKRE